jgi:hypothetical protein
MKLQDLGLTTLQSKVLRFIYSYTYLFEAVMLNVILPTVIMLYVVAPFIWLTVAKINKFPLGDFLQDLDYSVERTLSHLYGLYCFINGLIIIHTAVFAHYRPLVIT